MTESEALEVIAAFTSNAISAFTVYYSYTFAYLAVCYLVGSKLSNFQTIAVSVLYFASAALAVFTVLVQQRTVDEIMGSYPTVLDQNLFWSMQGWGM
ncbi:MAG: hypothetical protein ACI9BW_004516 [Gammaproteobacteria bacterium]|jgi:hypothetical protein